MLDCFFLPLTCPSVRWGSPEGPVHVEVPQKVQVTWKFTPGQAGSPEGLGHVEVPQKVQVMWRITLGSGGFARRSGSREDSPKWSGLGWYPRRSAGNDTHMTLLVLQMV